MPTRIIRPGILSSEPVCSLSWAEEVFYRRLMSVVDDHGRYHALPKLIRSACYPLQFDKVSDADIGKWISSCETAGLVSVYPASDGKRYIQIHKFDQQVRSKSKFPRPLDGEDSGFPATENNCKQLLANAHLDEVVDEVVFEDDKRRAPMNLFEGISESTVRDFKALRRAKKAPITETALAGIKREADKAGYTLEKALETCCERGWIGFKAEWVSGDRPSSGASSGAIRKRRELE